MSETQTINTIFKSNDYRELLDTAGRDKRSYNRQEAAKAYKPERARCKLKVWFTDGNAKSFFSYDNRKKPNGSVFIDEWTGMRKLVELIIKFDGKFKCCIIFATLDSDPLTDKSNYNIQVFKKTKTRVVENDRIGFGEDGIMRYFKERPQD